MFKSLNNILVSLRNLIEATYGSPEFELRDVLSAAVDNLALPSIGNLTSMFTTMLTNVRNRMQEAGSEAGGRFYDFIITTADSPDEFSEEFQRDWLFDIVMNHVEDTLGDEKYEELFEDLDFPGALADYIWSAGRLFVARNILRQRNVQRDINLQADVERVMTRLRSEAQRSGEYMLKSFDDALGEEDRDWWQK